MELVNVSSHVKHCYSNSDGEKIYNILYPKLKNEVKMNLSFINITSVTSSFVNSALIELLDEFEFDYIRRNLRFSNTSHQINDLINERFKFEVEKRNEFTSV